MVVTQVCTQVKTHRAVHLEVLHLTGHKLCFKEKEKRKRSKRPGTRGEFSHREAFHQPASGDYQEIGWQFPPPLAAHEVINSELSTSGHCFLLLSSLVARSREDPGHSCWSLGCLYSPTTPPPPTILLRAKASEWAPFLHPLPTSPHSVP